MHNTTRKNAVFISENLFNTVNSLIVVIESTKYFLLHNASLQGFENYVFIYFKHLYEISDHLHELCRNILENS